jgi:hypothetical protein
MPLNRLILVLLLLLLPLTAGAEEVTSSEVAPVEEAAPSEAATDEAEASAPVPVYVPSPLVVTDWTGGVVEARTGYVHPFISITEYYTDNLFETDTDTEEEFFTVISPGVWVALPASKQPFLRLSTLNTAPGGLDASRLSTVTNRRFQAYALYRADIREHSSFSEENKVDQRGEGLLRYKFRGGLSLQLDDIYELNQDPYSSGISQDRQLDEYMSNLAHLQIEYPVGPRLTIRGDYSHYLLDYDADRNSFRERDDDAFSAYLLYRMLPKTSLLLQYEHIDIDYDQDILADSTERHYYAGLQWDMTAKSRGRFMLGYGEKDFAAEAGSDQDDLLGEIQLDHRFTPKTSVYLRATRKTNESDIPNVENIMTHRTQLGYRQRLAAKLRASIDLFYLRDSYRGEITIDGQTDERKDDYYGAGLALGYTPLRWLNLTLGYRFTERASNFSRFDYQSNTFYLTLAAAM